jgi:long-chain acyl-CoA synthetase
MTILNLLVLGPLLAAQAAGCCVVMDRRDPEGIAEWIRVTAVTVWNGVPAMLHDLIESDSVQQRDLKTLREVWTGGSSCPTSIYEGFVEKFSVFPTSTYGLTEAPTIVSMDPIAGQHVAGSSGVALPHLRVAVLDAHGRELQEGQDGEICVQAMRSGPWTAVYQPMLGYWNKPAETAETLAGGYLHTGDIGRVDGQGQLFVVDRKNNLIVRGGANVYPAEVERVIKSLEGVRESVVLGVPDDRLGERVVAVIEGGAGSHLTAGMIASFCAQNLAKYKCPEEIRLVDALPRNAMGKIQRDAAAALFR